jgi:hypothetical protein
VQEGLWNGEFSGKSANAFRKREFPPATHWAAAARCNMQIDMPPNLACPRHVSHFKKIILYKGEFRILREEGSLVDVRPEKWYVYYWRRLTPVCI